MLDYQPVMCPDVSAADAWIGRQALLACALAIGLLLDAVPVVAIAAGAEPPVAPAVPAPGPGTTDPASTRDAAQQTFLRLMEEGRYGEAAAIATQIVDMTRRLHGEGSLATAIPLANLGTAQLQGGDLATAQASYVAAIDIIERRDGIASPRLVNPLTGLGEACLRAGLYPQATEAFQRALHVNHAAAGFYNLEQVSILDGLSEGFLGLEKLDKANAHQRAQVTIQQRHAPQDSTAQAQALQKLGRWYNRTGQYQAAQAAYQDARRVIRESGGNYDPRMIDALVGEALSHGNEGAMPVAATVLKRALDLVDAQPMVDHARRAEVLVALGDLQTAVRQPRAARQQYVEAWRELSGDGALLAARERHFAQPLRIGGPRLPDVVDENGRERGPAAIGQGAYDQGVVVAALTVTAQGRAADTRIIESTPPGLLDRQLLRALDGAAFRPAMADGEPVDRPDVRFRHEFRYSRATASRTGPPATESTPAAGGKGGPIAYPEAGHPAAGNHANP